MTKTSDSAAKKGPGRPRSLDKESLAIINAGASITQLGVIFDLDQREITKRIRGVSPVGERYGAATYLIKDVAPYLVPPQGNIEETIKKMSPKDLPPALSKEFWSAQHARLKFEEDRGDLWRTSDIVELLSEVFKTLRMTILLTQDHLEKQSQLTERQREAIREMVDGLLNDLADALVDRFKNEAPRKFDYDSPEGDQDGAEGL